MADVDGRAGTTAPLRLAVVDEEDLEVVAAHLQDADVTFADMAFLPRARRFVLVAHRFDWSGAAAGVCERCETGMHFERVLAAAHSGFSPDEADRKHRLVTVSFKAEDAPSGTVLFAFADGGMVRLTVECLEAEMRDMERRWRVDCRPEPLFDPEASVA